MPQSVAASPRAFGTDCEPEFRKPSPSLARYGIDWQKFDSNFESRFDANVAEFSDRIQKIHAPSNVALIELGITDSKFDVAYIDGSHRSADVYSDAVMVWPMVVRRGLIIFDDYQWGGFPGTRENPKLGIDCFLRAFEDRYIIVHHGYQVAIEKM
jgi:hypothetical protein